MGSSAEKEEKNLKGLKKSFDKVNKKTAQALRLFTQLHLEREHLLEEIAQRGVQKLENHEKEKYHKLLRKNVKRDEKVSKAVVKGIDEGRDAVHHLKKDLENAEKEEGVDTELRNHVYYLERLFESLKDEIRFLEGRSHLYRKNDGEFRLLLETVSAGHDIEVRRFKRILGFIEPSKLSDAERLGKKVVESVKRVVYPVGGALVGGWFGKVLTFTGPTSTSGQIQASPEQVRNAKLVGAIILGAVGFGYAIYEACKAVDHEENSFEARRDAAALAEQLEAYKK